MEETDKQNFRIQSRVCQIEKEMTKKELDCKQLKEMLECQLISKVFSDSQDGSSIKMEPT